MLSTEPEVGLDVTTPRSWPEPKSTVRHLTNWGTQVLIYLFSMTILSNSTLFHSNKMPFSHKHEFNNSTFFSTTSPLTQNFFSPQCFMLRISNLRNISKRVQWICPLSRFINFQHFAIFALYMTQTHVCMYVCMYV